jgi:hypothetical protein
MSYAKRNGGKVVAIKIPGYSGRWIWKDRAGLRHRGCRLAGQADHGANREPHFPRADRTELNNDFGGGISVEGARMNREPSCKPATLA